MRNNILIFLVLLQLPFGMDACDYCNCYIGLNPHYKKNSFGLRYHYLTYNGSHMSETELQELNLSKSDFTETRTNVELHGQWYPMQKLQLLFSLPYIINTESIKGNAEHASSSETKKGIGDAMLIAHYQLINKVAESYKGYSQRLFAGGGIKFPTGNYKLEEGAEAVERVHLPGSGSRDFILSTSYLGKIKKTGININASYLITTRNSQGFEFGKRLNANVTGYYEVKLKKAALYPSIGAYLEQASKDSDAGNAVLNTGGNIVYAHAGFDFYYKKFSVNIAAEIPALQQLNQPQPQVQYNLITGITFSLN